MAPSSPNSPPPAPSPANPPPPVASSSPRTTSSPSRKPHSNPSNSTSAIPPPASANATALPPSTGSGGNNTGGHPSPTSTHVPPPPGNDKGSRNHAPLQHSAVSSKSAPPPQQQYRNTVELNVPLVIGVTAGTGAFVVLLIIAYLCSLSKRMRSHKASQSYLDHSRGGPRAQKGLEYIYSGGVPTWSVGPPSTDVGTMKPPPPPDSVSLSPWMAPPPPPPLLVATTYSGPQSPPLPPPSPNIALGFNKSTFTYDELSAATNGFSRANILGQGGFGYVHKGVLPNGKEVAVKSLKSGSGQGEREFQAEVEIISRVHHRHLVSLVGYCIAGGQRMLVYEFVPNNTLEFHLHGRDRPTMDFPTRLKIALGSAKGLAYLHEDCHPKIIHRDIKAANILLDDRFEAMVADFGLAKLSSDSHTHVSTRVMGTFGYLAPEYASSGKLTEKSDVFSFGVMLLELITGRRPVDTTATMTEDSLVDWARSLLTRAMTDGDFDGLVDPKLGKAFNPNEMTRLVACAAACVRHSGRRRPKMGQIVRALEGDSSLEDLNDGMRPGHSSAFGSGSSTDYDSTPGSCKSQMRWYHKMANASEDFGSSEFGATSVFAPDLYSPSTRDVGNFSRGR